MRLAVALVNAAVAVGFASLLALLLARLWRPHPGWIKAALLLPWTKLAVVPWQLGATPQQARFALGLDLRWPFLPSLQGVLGMRQHGDWIALSVGELVVHRALRSVSAGAIAIVAWVVLGVGAVRLLRRLFVAWRFERPAGILLDRVRVGGRWVDVLLTAYGSVPFTSGVRRPWVCIPADAFARLGPAERAAALAHELAHVRAFDVVWLGVVGACADVLWFVPGATRLLRALHLASERAADEAAVRRGTDPADLASALVCLGGRRPAAVATGLTSHTAARVRALLGPAKTRPAALLLRVVLGLLCAHAMLASRVLV